MSKESIVHYDMFGIEIVPGQYAVSFESNSLKIFQINKINPKKVTLKHRKMDYTVLRYPKDMVVVPTEQVMLKLLKD